MRAIATSLLALGFCVTAAGGEPSEGRGAGRALTRADEKKAKDNKSEKKSKPKFTVGKETTYVTGPLDEDGFIDYAAALNERLRKGVTPDKNANVLIWKAFGPHPEGAKMPAEFFKWLRIDPLPEKGNYFIPQSRYAREQLKIEPGPALTAFIGEIDRATHSPWSAKRYPRVADWLKANEKPLALVHEATKRPQYFSPLVPTRSKKGTSGLIGALLPAVQKCRELAQALNARAMLAIGEGRYNDAWQDLLACHRLGRLVARGATLIEALVGIAIDMIASSADVALLERAVTDAKVEGKTIRGWQGDLRRLPPMPGIAEKIDLGERFMCLDCFMMVARGGLATLEGLSGGSPKPTNPLMKHALDGINWDPALRLANRWYDRMVAALRIKDRAKREKRLKEIEADLKKDKKEIVDMGELSKLLLPFTSTPKKRGELIGRVMISLLMPAVIKIQQASDRSEQIQRNLHVAFALACYRRELGRYPEKLDALAPGYLERVPQDIFSGAALIYRRSEKGYLLYSVGVNERDDGGRTFSDAAPGDDLSIRIPLPESRQ